MVEITVEKEIKVKNKVIKGFTLRQVIGIGTGFIVGFLLMKIVGLPFSEAYYCFLATGIIAYLIGWYNKDNLYIENIAKKKFEAFLYRNTKRKYRTRNQYIKMYNKEYSKMRQKDMNNKQIQKHMKQDRKALEKKQKNAKIHGYA